VIAQVACDVSPAASETSSRHRSAGSPRQNIIDGIDDVAALHFESRDQVKAAASRCPGAHRPDHREQRGVVPARRL